MSRNIVFLKTHITLTRCSNFTTAYSPSRPSHLPLRPSIPHQLLAWSIGPPPWLLRNPLPTPPTTIKGGALIRNGYEQPLSVHLECNDMGTLLPFRFGFSGNQLHERKFYGTTLYPYPPPPPTLLHGFEEYMAVYMMFHVAVNWLMILIIFQPNMPPSISLCGMYRILVI